MYLQEERGSYLTEKKMVMRLTKGIRRFGLFIASAYAGLQIDGEATNYARHANGRDRLCAA